MKGNHLSDYDYELPRELIAERPPERRDASRMMLLHRDSGQVSHHLFPEITRFVSPGDLLVMNDSRVIPARLHDRSGRIEMLLLEKRDSLHWTAMVNPGRKMRPGAVVETAGTTATVLEILEDGHRLLEFAAPPDLEHHGEMPIPPYFHRAADDEDKVRYQTVYAREEGSVAAPTAGLHFTPELLGKLPHAFLTLHVGAGTFLPVKSDDLSSHRMHSERYTLAGETAERINATKEAGGRVIAVGTTSARVLESQHRGALRVASGSTDIFIKPPHLFHHTDALLTNFHLPCSTLLMLVSALAGRETILRAYAEAVRERYRFFSYGDCMLIL